MRYRHALGRFCSTLALIAPFATGGAQATVTVPWDGAGTYGCIAGGGDFLCGQSFTVPTTAPVLQSFTYDLQTAFLLSFELYSLGGGQITGPAILTQPIGPTLGYRTIAFGLVGGVPLIGGAQYAAMVRLNAGEEVSWLANWSAPYPDGTVLYCQTGFTGGQPPCADFPFPRDLVFTATFGPAVTTAPEPATLLLLAPALAVLGVARRRRSRA